MLKAFVTGASGFIGRRLVKALLDLGWDVRILIHEKSIPEAEFCEVIEGDITDGESLKKGCRDRDALFHLSAALGGSLIPKAEFFRINAQGTTRVLEAAGEASVGQVLHVSSAGVLGSVRTGEAADEDFPGRPKNPYDRSKGEGERIALGFAGKGMNVTIVRPGWVYGPGDRRTFKLIAAIARKRFTLLTGRDTLQTPVFIDDLIPGLLLAQEKGRRGEVYHLAGSEVLTVESLVDTVARVCGTRVVKCPLPRPLLQFSAALLGGVFSRFGREAPLTPGKLAFFIHPKPLDIAKARRELGYSPSTSFRQGIRTTVDWYRDNGWL